MTPRSSPTQTGGNGGEVHNLTDYQRGWADGHRAAVTRYDAATPNPIEPRAGVGREAALRSAAQEMLFAFAEGVEWTDDKRAAYLALDRALFANLSA